MSSRTDPSHRPEPAARREPVSRSHRATQVVLVVGSVLALGAALGPRVARPRRRRGRRRHLRGRLRAGLARARRAPAAGTRSGCWRVDRRHGDTLRTERTRNAEVVDALSERLRSTGMVVVGQRSTIAQLRGEVGVLTTERDGLREQVAERDSLIGLFRASLREQEVALLAVRAQQARARASRSAPPPTPRCTPSRAVRAPRTTGATDRLDPQMAELAMVLPNYETTSAVGRRISTAAASTPRRRPAATPRRHLSRSPTT